MEILKIIPQSFFDGIARLVPGSCAIFSYFWLFDPNWENWKWVMIGLGGQPENGAYSIVLVSATLLWASFVAGHVISPLAKLVQRLGEQIPSKLAKAPKGQYDWLRMHKPEAGALCAKIRAEFVMFNGLTIVFFCICLASLANGAGLLPVSGFGVLSLLMFYRGRETNKTFNETVEKFHLAQSGS